jgi:hypothetical protein
MKNKLFVSSFIITLITFSCKKEGTFVCVCTDTTTGEKAYGDTFSENAIAVQMAKEGCEISSSEQQSCVLEKQ